MELATKQADQMDQSKTSELRFELNGHKEPRRFVHILVKYTLRAVQNESCIFIGLHEGTLLVYQAVDNI